MSTNFILVFLLVITVVLSIFLPNIIDDTDFGGIGGELPDEPSPWDVLVFNAGFIWSAMTFSIDGMPAVMGTVFWVVSFLWVYCAVRLVRGTS